MDRSADTESEQDFLLKILTWPSAPERSGQAFAIVGKLLIMLCPFSWTPMTVIVIGCGMLIVAYFLAPRKQGHEAANETHLESVIAAIGHEPFFVTGIAILGTGILLIGIRIRYLVVTFDPTDAIRAHLPMGWW